jgi:hypothetical protein
MRMNLLVMGSFIPDPSGIAHGKDRFTFPGLKAKSKQGEKVAQVWFRFLSKGRLLRIQQSTKSNSIEFSQSWQRVNVHDGCELLP